MPVTEYQWKSFDRLDLYALQWPSNEHPETVVAFAPGHGDHLRRYDEWFPKLAKRNIAVFAIDYRGHGRSQGRRGVIRRFDDLLKDVTATRKLYDGMTGQINYREWEYAGDNNCTIPKEAAK